MIRKLTNPTDAFLWAQDNNGNPVPLKVDSSGRLIMADTEDNGIDINEHILLAMGHEQVTVTTAAVSSLTVPPNTKRALIFVGGTAEEEVKWRADGTNPTGDIGMEVMVGDYIDLTDLRINYGTFLQNMRFKGKTGNTTNITLEVLYLN